MATGPDKHRGRGGFMGEGMNLKGEEDRGALSVQGQCHPLHSEVFAPSLAELQGPEMTWD